MMASRVFVGVILLKETNSETDIMPSRTKAASMASSLAQNGSRTLKCEGFYFIRFRSPQHRRQSATDRARRHSVLHRDADRT